jgi:hypothetical protein
MLVCWSLGQPGFWRCHLTWQIWSALDTQQRLSILRGFTHGFITAGGLVLKSIDGYDMLNISICIKSTLFFAGGGGVLVLVTLIMHSDSGLHQLLEELLASNAVSVEDLSKMSDNFGLEVRGFMQLS